VLKNIFIGVLGLLAGIAIGYVIIQNIPFFTSKETSNTLHEISDSLGLQQNNVVGFLPYWLINSAKNDYSAYITTLTYFGLTLEPDGTIQKFTNPGESEPGWYSLDSGKVDNMLATAKRKKLNLSLLIFSGNEETIANLMENPEKSADNMITEVAPVMKKYGFTDLNIDIESVKDASPEARVHFTSFMKRVRKHVNEKHLGTLTIDVSPTALLRDYLIDVDEVAPYVDYMIFMTYDYHYSGSTVTGPVSPIGGMGKEAEFDTETAIKLAKQVMPENKILVGMPSYGYGWETLQPDSRSATIPGSGYVISNRKLEEQLKDCEDCKITFDKNAKEYYVLYTDSETGTYHQIYYPEKEATQEKINLAEKYHIGGIAIWALGYEGNTIMDPLKSYKQ
jgi:spore germination protein YaaH